MVSLWQRIFNILVTMALLYFFWVTGNLRAVMKDVMDLLSQ